MNNQQQMLLDKLAENAESIISSRCLKSCRLILTAAKLVSDSPYPDEQGLFAAFGKALSTHYVVALIWAGHSRAEENGIEVYCLPKKRLSEDRIATIVAVLIKVNDGRNYKNAAKPTEGDWKGLAGSCAVKTYESLLSQQEQKLHDIAEPEPLSGDGPIKEVPELKLWAQVIGENINPAIYELLKPLILDLAIIEEAATPLTQNCDRDAYIQEAASRFRAPIVELISHAAVTVADEELRQICVRTSSEAFALRRLRMALLAGEITLGHIEQLGLYRIYKNYFWRTPDILSKEREVGEHFKKARAR